MPSELEPFIPSFLWLFGPFLVRHVDVVPIFFFYKIEFLLGEDVTPHPIPNLQGLLHYLQQRFSIHFETRTCFNAKYKNKWNKNHQFLKKKKRRCFPYSGNAVSLKHNQREARYKRLRSDIYRLPLFNGCTLYQIRFPIFLFVWLGYSGKLQGS